MDWIILLNFTIRNPIKNLELMSTTEELIIKRIEGAMRGLRLGTKKLEDLNVNPLLDRLNTLNKFTYKEMDEKFEKAVNDYRNKLDKQKAKKVW